MYNKLDGALSFSPTCSAPAAHGRALGLGSRIVMPYFQLVTHPAVSNGAVPIRDHNNINHGLVGAIIRCGAGTHAGLRPGLGTEFCRPVGLEILTRDASGLSHARSSDVDSQTGSSHFSTTPTLLSSLPTPSAIHVSLAFVQRPATLPYRQQLTTTHLHYHHRPRRWRSSELRRRTCRVQ